MSLAGVNFFGKFVRTYKNIRNSCSWCILKLVERMGENANIVTIDFN